MCAGRDLAASGSEVSQPALIGHSQAGFVQRCRARRGLHHLFVSSLPGAGDILYMRAPALRELAAVRKKEKEKVSEEKRVSG